MQVSPKGGTRYVSVVMDDYADGERRVKTLRSFGAESADSLVEAHQFKANCEAVQGLSKKAAEDDATAKAILVFFGILLGAAVIAYLLGREE